MSGPPLPRFVPNPDRPVYGETPRPEWLKVRLVDNEDTRGILDLVRRKHLNTVCQEAQCPNIFECWGRERTATFMLMGDVCTRRCGFCAVTQGIGRPLDPEEPRHVAEAVKELGVRHAVVTSVNRDELPDGGAAHFAATIGAIRAANPGVTVEVLIPDFLGSEAALRTVLEAAPEVLNHNTETVPRLYRKARPGGRYPRALELLDRARRYAPHIPTKSGLMVGLGEEWNEIVSTLADLRGVGCGILTIGQYLSPSSAHLPVARYYHPEEFEMLKSTALSMGFGHVESGPLVRSSYHAHEQADSYERMAR